jgi:hypothetical protein
MAENNYIKKEQILETQPEEDNREIEVAETYNKKRKRKKKLSKQ